MTYIKATVIKALSKMVGQGNAFENELLSKHTSFKIGGPADLLVTPTSVDILIEVLTYLRAHKVPFFVMGNGSNLLAHDYGYRGVIVKISKNLSHISVEGGGITAEAGILLSKLASIIASNDLMGFEFASGIPGTLGGGIFMNAGAYGGEIKDVLIWADLINEAGELIRLNKDELALGYRTSLLQSNQWIAVRGHMHFDKGEESQIRDKMKALNQRRQDKQPIELPSAGSAFKRPEGHYAGKLIMDAGLSGFAIGGAAVSEKHCGFIVNQNQATATEVIQLVEHIKQVVLEKFNVVLEPELRIIH